MYASATRFLRYPLVGIAVLLLSVTLLACGDDDDPVNGMNDPEGQLSAGVTSVDFGEVAAVEESATETFTIENDGDAVLAGSVGLVAGDEHFTIDDGEGGFTLDPGASQSITITYAPQSVETHEGTVSITHDGSNDSPVDVALTGEGTGIPDPPDRPD
ncbi:MAG: choice-of-anchor D domain-containing protein [Bacteroidetes bacterium]|jgi:hypothetical protein|nr:choice-of-anchor D domain-containing protein [Bacteroidota bacterium]